MKEARWHARRGLPAACDNGHLWEADPVAISWAPCDCPAPPADAARGHVMVHCRRLGCAETWQTDAATLFAVLGDRGNGGSADRGRVHALDLLNTAWSLLMQAPEHQLVLRRPSHPGAGRIAEMQ